MITVQSGSPGVAILDGPMAHDNYKRAVYRAPPARFTVAMLPPSKQGSSIGFSMRVTPVLRGDRSSICSGGSSGSGGSNRSNVEYDVWRKWEDCLWFQDTLELEYSRMARMKRQRLLNGKGVKKDGFYMQDKASSWESLPPGPDPNSVAQDIHELIPKLTKKGTLFRPSQATIDQRNKELTAFVTELFKSDVPALLEELRSDRIVTDFFGYWRRDYDLDMKHSAVNGKPGRGRNSISSSVFSSYFSSSNLNVADSDSKSTISNSSSSPTSSSKSPRISVTTEAYRYAKAQKQKQSRKEVDEKESPRHRVTSTMSTSSTSSDSSSSSRNSASSVTSVSTSTSIPEEASQRIPRLLLPSERFLNSLSETGTPSHSDSEGVVSGTARRPKKRSSRETLYRRSARIFTAPVGINEDDGLKTPTAAYYRAYRDSWQTTGSASTYLEGLNVTMPASPAHVFHKSRLSIGSIATFMTDSSADAVVSRSDIRTPISRQKLLSLGNRKSRPVSVYTVGDEGPWSDGDEDILDSYLFDQFPMPAHLFPPREDDENETATLEGDTKSEESGATESRAETPLGRRASISSYMTASDGQTVSEPPAIPPMSPVSPLMPPSPTFSVASSTAFSVSSAAISETSTAMSSPSRCSASSKSITIKAAHNKSIILLRIPRDTEFGEIRHKLQDKFVTQEKVPLSESFTIAYVSVIPDAMPKPVDEEEENRARSDSVSSMSGMQMSLVTCQEEWELALSSTESSKITLRILDTIS
ncbi:hypothetical protein VKT23_018795 [Stygiomarasmius scandens]|uniref:PX domain-containing protein n=1 Tax=Marasmiellus scandens TaxID=2682957 RepID=A0ABR1IS25_9AGAR